MKKQIDLSGMFVHAWVLIALLLPSPRCYVAILMALLMWAACIMGNKKS